ncbi:MAG: hypothetical protein ACRDYD_13915, partial [Acidimicrobiales bacterium]
VAGFACLGSLLAGCSGSAPAARSKAPPSTPRSTVARPVAPTSLAVHASFAPFQLPAPVSREVVLAERSSLLILGGLDAAGSSAAGIFRVSLPGGQLSEAGSLAMPTHDAGGAILGGAALVFGGGAATVYDAVQSWSPGSQAATVVSHLPRARADLSVAGAAGEAYVVGGYDGAAADAAVLATGDGRSFRTVASLPQPVRYAAVAVLHGILYVFGGESGGSPSAAIQAVDLASGTARMVGKLPEAVSGAGAAVLDGRVLVIGGKTSGGYSAAVLAFDPGAGDAVQVGTMPEAVANAGVAVVGARVYLVGGEGPSTLSRVVQIADA